MPPANKDVFSCTTNLLDKFPYNFRSQFLNIGAPIHNSHEVVSIQHGVLPSGDFLLQLAGQGK